MKSKIPQETVDFQPDAIQIRDEKLPLWARMSILFSFLFFAAAVAWACIARVDVIVQAPGKIVSDKQIIAIKPIDTSIIEKVHVKIGDIVEKGDILISFDQTINQKEIQRLEREICVLETKVDRFTCEFEKRDYKPSAPKYSRLPRSEYERIGKAEKAISRREKEQLAIKAPDVETAAGTLSGGNQQKVVIAKQLAASSRIIILDEPTKGVDIGSKAAIYELMAELAAQGVAILMISSEMPEVMNMSDRIYVMSEGHITKEFTDVKHLTQQQILEAAMPQERTAGA